MAAKIQQSLNDPALPNEVREAMIAYSQPLNPAMNPAYSWRKRKFYAFLAKMEDAYKALQRGGILP